MRRLPMAPACERWPALPRIAAVADVNRYIDMDLLMEQKKAAMKLAA